MKQPIVGYHHDEERHWVAKLACGHNQHVRHNPPWVSRPWVITATGRRSMLGHELDCKKCDEGAPRDWEEGELQDAGAGGVLGALVHGGDLNP